MNTKITSTTIVGLSSIIFLSFLFTVDTWASQRMSQTELFTISGTIPVIIKSNIYDYNRSLTFNPKEYVKEQVIGKIHIMYNTSIDEILLTSEPSNGLPVDDNGVSYPFGKAGFKTKIANCTRELVKRPIESGVDATCDLLASWEGSDDITFKSQSKYSINYSVTIVPSGI